jgi:hypothetical protein
MELRASLTVDGAMAQTDRLSIFAPANQRPVCKQSNNASWLSGEEKMHNIENQRFLNSYSGE